jgi:hypothetical protein
MLKLVMIEEPTKPHRTCKEVRIKSDFPKGKEKTKLKTI